MINHKFMKIDIRTTFSYWFSLVSNMNQLIAIMININNYY